MELLVIVGKRGNGVEIVEMMENMKTIIEQMFKLFFRLNFVIPTEMPGES